MRLAALLATAVLLVSMAGWTRSVERGEVGVLSWLTDPTEADGREVVVPLADVLAVDGDGYDIAKGMVRLRVRSPGAAPAVGETVTVAGRWSAKEGRIDERWHEAHPWRPAKKALGVVGLAASLALGVVVLRRSPAGLVVRGA